MSLIIKITMSKQTNILENGSSQQNLQNDNVGKEEMTEGNGNANGPSTSSSRDVISEMETNVNVAEEDLNVNKNEIQKSSSCSKLSLIKKSRSSCKSATRSNTTQNCTADGVANTTTNVKKKGHKWALKFNCAKLKPKSTQKSARVVNGNDMCVCTGYRKVESDNSSASAKAENNNASSTSPSCAETGADVVSPSDLSYDAATNHSRLDQLLNNESDPSSALQRVSVGDARDNVVAPVAGNIEIPRDARRSNMTLEERQRLFARNDGLSLPVVLFSFPPLIDLSKFNPEDYPTEDIEARARLQRALEIEEGVDAPPGFRPNVSAASSTTGTPTTDPLLSPMAWWLDNHQTSNCAASTQDILSTGTVPRHWQVLCSPDLNVDSLRAIFNQHFAMQEGSPRVHTQVDYIHCLVPDLKQITACSFYWGKMDRYEAETLLEGKPEGTFLLRDSAQEEYLFSVSFRKYGRSLHARIEQFNHRFSFDSHDPGVFSSNSVTGLLEHYKDPSCVMFFEPMLTVPLNRNFTFSLQQLCRSVIVTNTTYDGIASLNLPRSLRSYLREYHYRQRVRVKRFEDGQ